MKRRGDSTCDQPSRKRLSTASCTDSLRSKIAAKLHTLFDGFSSRLQNVADEDKRPDIKLLFSTEQVSQNLSSPTPVVKTELAENVDDYVDTTTIALKNFINTAKSKITELLSKEQENICSFQRQKDSDGGKKFLPRKGPQAKVKTLKVDPLQTQIYLKLQSLLCKALDNKRLANNVESKRVSNSKDILTEKDWQDFSHIVQDFIGSTDNSPLESTEEPNKFSNKYSIDSRSQLSNQNSNDVSSSYLNSHCELSSGNNAKSHKHCKNREHSEAAGTTKQLNKHLLNRERGNFLQEALSSTSQSLIMDSQIYYESTSLIDYGPEDSVRNLETIDNGGSGLLLLENAERCPDSLTSFLHLEVDTDVDEPSSDDAEDVIVLGEKRPTYEVITLEEDDDDDNCSQVKENEETGDVVEELLYSCPHCEKSFRVESLLKFHIRMHGAESPSPEVPVSSTTPLYSSSNDEDCNTDHSAPSCEQRPPKGRSEKSLYKMSSKSSKSYKRKLRQKKHGVDH